MVGVLIKTDSGFYLWLNPTTKYQELIAANVPIMNDYGFDLRKYKLSTENCEEIDNTDGITTWYVNIKTRPYTEVSEGFKLEAKIEPKIDENGYLILKKI